MMVKESILGTEESFASRSRLDRSRCLLINPVISGVLNYVSFNFIRLR